MLNLSHYVIEPIQKLIGEKKMLLYTLWGCPTKFQCTSFNVFKQHVRVVQFYWFREELVYSFTNDTIGELKASANLGSTYKAIGNFKEALLFTRHQLELSRRVQDRVRYFSCYKCFLSMFYDFLYEALDFFTSGSTLQRMRHTKGKMVKFHPLTTSVCFKNAFICS